MQTTKPLPANELAKMLRALSEPRDRMLLLLLTGTGLRLGEALSLRLSHIADPNGRINECGVVPRGHARSPSASRLIWLCPELRQALSQYVSYMEIRDPAGVLFPSRKGENLPISPRHATRALLPAFQAVAKHGRLSMNSPRVWFIGRVGRCLENDPYAIAVAKGAAISSRFRSPEHSVQRRIRRAIFTAMTELFSESLPEIAPESQGDEECPR